MIKTVVSDFSKVLLFAKDPNYQAGLNSLNNRLLLEDPSYPFFDYFVLNEELLRHYEQLKSKMPVFVFTSETIQDHPAIKERIRNTFSGVFSAQELKLKKSEPATYVSIAHKVNCQPNEVLYIDDKPSNIEAAASAGLRTILFTANNEVIAELDSLPST